MYPQHLPTYIHTFLDYPDWRAVESAHYIFNYTNGSEAEREIQHIIHTQEEGFTRILNVLKIVPPTKKITYYFYPNEQLKMQLMGDDWYAQSIYNEFCVHVLYTSEHKPIGPHEDTHLLSLPWGLSWCFLQEGLAEHIVGHSWDKCSHIEKMKEGIAKGINLYPSTQLSDEDWLNTSDDGAIYYYALAGSWATFLIEQYGLECFKNLYTNTHNTMSRSMIESAYMKYYGVSLENLERQYFQKILGSRRTSE